LTGFIVNKKCRVNAISPGPIDTPMLSSVGKVPGEEELMKIITSSVPLDRMGNPDEIAKADTSGNDDSIIQTLKNQSYACIFTDDNIDDNNSTIVLANGMTMDELNKEKSRTKDKCMCERQI
jgi:hypothetical protein